VALNRTLAATIAAFNLLAVSPAFAMTYQRLPLEEGATKIIVTMNGRIQQGDGERFARFLRALPASDRIVAFAIDSPGGNVMEASYIARAIRKADLPLFVTDGSTCASACFLIYAAATIKTFSRGSFIGIHSVSDQNGDENPLSMAMTTGFARDLAGYGVPSAIIGKLVITEPGKMTWLSADELVAMGSQYIRQGAIAAGEPTSASSSSANGRVPAPSYPSSQQGSALATIAPAVRAPSTMPSSQEAAVSTRAYADGRRDRIIWERWFGGLPVGTYRDGAFFWSGERSKPNPGSCDSPNGDKMWASGCNAARSLLAPFDIRRKTEPDYWWGWNSL